MFEDDRNSSDGCAMKHIAIYNSSCTSISYMGESFHFLCTWFGYIHLIETDALCILDFSYETKAAFLYTKRKVREAFFLKEVTSLLCVLLTVLGWIHPKFSHNGSFMCHHGREER